MRRTEERTQPSGASIVALVSLALLCNSAQTLGEEEGLGNSLDCQRYSGLPVGWGKDANAGMVWIEGGEFPFGSENGYADERPERLTAIDSFWIDRTEVTVAQFAAFVTATGYVTEAERTGGGAVFRVPQAEELTRLLYPWWEHRSGADWRHPQGPGSSAKPNHPVTLVTYQDAEAYAHWLDHELPSEAEWEYAAKAGQGQNPDMDQEPRDRLGHPQANFWQGHFPRQNNAEDGHVGIAPVGCYPANGFGLFDMVGNVWEQTADVYRPRHGDETSTAMARAASNRGMVIKGGSHLCAQEYCVRYRPSSREAHEANLAISHTGFRTVSRTRSFWSFFR